jgi:hypothetical protein
MPDKQRKAKTPPPNYRVGDRVRFHFPSQTAEGVIVEDRGGLGVGGRRLYGIRFRWGDEESYIELPEEEMEAIRPEARSRDGSPSPGTKGS